MNNDDESNIAQSAGEGRGCRIHRLHPCREVRLSKREAQSAAAVEYIDCTSAEGNESPNECPGYDIKQSDGEVPVMLELWTMRSTPSLPSLPGPLGPGVVAPDRVLFMGRIELNYLLILN